MADYFHTVSRTKHIKILSAVLMLLAFMLVSYVTRVSEGNPSALPASSCPSCYCDCLFEPSLSLEVINRSLADCSKDDPETINEMKKSTADLLFEEIMLQENVTKDNLELTRSLTANARRTSSLYRKEAQKCKAGVETCEEAREKAEVEIVRERMLTALWMKRARQYGWRETTPNKSSFAKLAK